MPPGWASTPLESLFFSCIIYAGASQFVDHRHVVTPAVRCWVAALTVMAMDVRHVLRRPSLRSAAFAQRWIKSKLPSRPSGLTDEVFAAATARLVRDNRRWSENWMPGLALLVGIVGVRHAGRRLVRQRPAGGFPAVEAALGFVLPALFMSFLLASFQRQQSPCVTAALAGAGRHSLFSIPAAILAGIVCGCLTALLQAMLKGMPDEQWKSFCSG